MKWEKYHWNYASDSVDDIETLIKAVSISCEAAETKSEQVGQNTESQFK